MADLVRVEPALFRADEAWFVFSDGRKLLRKTRSEPDTPFGPSIVTDAIEPVVSMADGKTYDSKSALYRSYRPDGNPQGVRYECTGEADTSKFERPRRDKAEAIAAIKRAMGEL